MKKLVALFALALIVAFAASSYAEVQNVKVGGDIRIRGNYSDNVATLTDSEDNFGFIQQRTRAIVEADLTDNVAVNATIEAESVWGDGTDTNTTTAGVDIRSEWDAGFSEAWVQLSELYYSPLTVKIGRQYLHYGTGFIISSAEYENNFDAVKAVLNFEPWTIDVIYAKLVESGATDNDLDLWGGNIRYSADTWNLEGYVFGAVDGGLTVNLGSVTTYTTTETAAGVHTTTATTTTLTAEPNIEPIVFGIRGDITPIENLDLWGELAYETGDLLGVDLSAFGADVGGTYSFPDVTWRPTIGLAWTYGQGDNEDLGDNFYEFFEYDYYGYLFSPAVTNIHIINANLIVEPIEKLALILDYYHYLQDEELARIVGDPFQDNGGVSAVTNGTETTLGNEVDVIAEYDYTEDVSTQLYLAWFWPGDAYDGTTGEDDAYEVRGEIIVSF